jgi:hypothetical protein
MPKLLFLNDKLWFCGFNVWAGSVKGDAVIWLSFGANAARLG